MSRLRPNWLLGIVSNLNGVETDELQEGKLLVVRNGIILSEGEGNDYTYDGTNVEFLIDISPTDVILFVDPSIGAVRRLQGGTNVIVEEPEVEEVVTPPPAPKQEPPQVKEPEVEVTDVTSSDSEGDDETSEATTDDDPQPRKGSSRRRRT